MDNQLELTIQEMQIAKQFVAQGHMSEAGAAEMLKRPGAISKLAQLASRMNGAQQ